MNFVSSIKNIITSTIKDDCVVMAASMAFNLILTLFPFLVAVTAIFGLLGTEQTIDQIVLSIKSIAPSEALVIVEKVLRETFNSSSRGILTVSFLIGIVFASNAINVLMKLLNKAYGVPETRSVWRIRALTLWVIILFILAVFLIANLIIMGQVILAFLDHFLGIHETVITAINFARWPVTFLMLFIIGFIIYYFIPNISAGFKNRLLSSLPGTLFFTLAWLTMSRLFGLYVENFAQFNKVYGTFGAVIILLLWLYYTSLVILIGGEVNSEVYRQIKTRET